MQSILVNPKVTRDHIISIKEYQELPNNHEFVLYADNILEGITLLNNLAVKDDILSFCYVVYQPIDQPIYIFSDENSDYYSVKICGAYDKWNLPDDVRAIISYVDLPDYVLYSLGHKKAILAGENTETASVGNSQWQREGRKVAAARNGVPFIYQTFYSGKDESQDTVREPNALQVYNQILYTARYKVPSFVAYFENNFEGAKTRTRTPVDSQELFVKYIKMILLCDVNNNDENLRKKQDYEIQFVEHMLNYLAEGKCGAKARAIDRTARINKDLPTIDVEIRNSITQQRETFAKELIDYIYEKNDDFSNHYDLVDIDKSDLPIWKSYLSKKYIKDLLQYLQDKGTSAKTYAKGNTKVGIAKTKYCKDFLYQKFPQYQAEINAVLGTYEEVVLMPLRIHKESNGELTFSPDPESGEIVAFGELLGYDMVGNKTRSVLGYCIVDTPEQFAFAEKSKTKLYKAIANYVDLLILNDNQLISAYNSLPSCKKEYFPTCLQDIHPLGFTEEMAIVATFLQLSTIKADWRLCFVHTHHSSWQQVIIDGHQEKIHRKSTKIDLLMQQGNTFMLAEGKNYYNEIARDRKIKRAMEATGEVVDRLHGPENLKFDAFIYNLNMVGQDSLKQCLECELQKIQNDIKQNGFSRSAHHENYVVIIVYVDQSYQTNFKLVFSDDFDADLRQKLEAIFV